MHTIHGYSLGWAWSMVTFDWRFICSSGIVYRYRCSQGSFPAGTPGNGVPKVILTVATAFKPALCEMYKKHPVCTKIRLFQIPIRHFFLGKGHSPQTPQVGRRKPPSHNLSPSAPRVYGAWTRRLTRRLRCLVPHLLILKPHCLVPTLLFLGNDPWLFQFQV